MKKSENNVVRNITVIFLHGENFARECQKRPARAQSPVAAGWTRVGVSVIMWRCRDADGLRAQFTK